MCIRTVQKPTFLNHASADKACRARSRCRALTPVKQTGLWGSNVLRHGRITQCQRILRSLSPFNSTAPPDLIWFLNSSLWAFIDLVFISVLSCNWIVFVSLLDKNTVRVIAENRRERSGWHFTNYWALSVSSADVCRHAVLLVSDHKRTKKTRFPCCLGFLVWMKIFSKTSCSHLF